MSKPLGLGPNGIAWCRKNIDSFPEMHDRALAAEAHAAELRAKIGEPTHKPMLPMMVCIDPALPGAEATVYYDAASKRYGVIGVDVAPRPSSLAQRIIGAVRRA